MRNAVRLPLETAEADQVADALNVEESTIKEFATVALQKLIGFYTAAAAYVKAVQYTNVLQPRGFKQKLIDFIGRNFNEVCNTLGWLRKPSLLYSTMILL